VTSDLLPMSQSGGESVSQHLTTTESWAVALRHCRAGVHCGVQPTTGSINPVQTAQLIFAVSAIMAGTACVITANVIFYHITDEVNSKLPPDQQFDFFSVGRSRLYDILRQHAGLFPTSRKRKRAFIWVGIGFALFVLTLFSGFL